MHERFILMKTIKYQLFSMKIEQKTNFRSLDKSDIF